MGRNILFAILFLTMIFIFGFLIGCESASSDIQAVKKTTFYGQNITIEDALNNVAGIKGEIEWRAFKPSEHADNPDIVCIEANISKMDKKGEGRKAKVQYLYNRKNKVAKIGYIEIDGKPQSILSGAIMLQLLSLE